MNNNPLLDPTKKSAIDAFLSKGRLAHLATTNPVTLQPHLTTVWYDWDGQSILISAYSSTRKMRDLMKNPRCAVLVDTDEPGVSPQAVLFEGSAQLLTGPREMIEPVFTRIYTRYIGPEGVLEKDPQDWIHSIENVLVKLTPEKVYTW